jgi:hypothetical protein
MLKLTKLIWTALAAAMVLAVAVSPASALRRIEISTTAFLAHGRITFTETGGASQACDVTLHITANRLINKIRGELIGHVTSTLTANPTAFTTCRPLSPMLVMYNSIAGSLPIIEQGGRLDVRGGFLITNPFFRCLFSGTISGTSRTNPVRTLEVSSAAGAISTEVRLELSGAGTCPAEGRLTGTMTSRPEVTIRLLE